MRAVSIAALIMTILPGLTLGGDWPQFRGPGAEGHSTETGLPTEWGPDRNIVWSRAIPGEGWSSPAIVGERTFLTTAVQQGSGLSLQLFCLDTGTGEVRFEKELFRIADAPRIHNKNSHASPTPLISEGRVYVHFGTLGTACVDLDGTIVWKTQELKYNHVHGSGPSPVLADGRLFLVCDGGNVQFVAALDAETGELLWRSARPKVSERKKFSFVTPRLIEVDGQPQLISPAAHQVVAYNPANGEQLWRLDYTGYSVIPRPVFAHGLLFFSTSYDQAEVLAVRPKSSTQQPEIVWRMSRGAPHTPSMLVIGDELYMVSDRGIATCVDARTGEQHWKERLGGNYSASPVFADGRIYFTSEDGKTTVIEPGTEYRELAVNEMDERTLASLAIADGAIFLRTAERLYRIED